MGNKLNMLVNNSDKYHTQYRLIQERLDRNNITEEQFSIRLEELIIKNRNTIAYILSLKDGDQLELDFRERYL